METQKIAIFKNKSIRKVIHKNEWWFSVIDVVGALTESSIPRRYWSDLKIKITKEESVSGGNRRIRAVIE